MDAFAREHARRWAEGYFGYASLADRFVKFLENQDADTQEDYPRVIEDFLNDIDSQAMVADLQTEIARLMNSGEMISAEKVQTILDQLS